MTDDTRFDAEGRAFEAAGERRLDQLLGMVPAATPPAGLAARILAAAAATPQDVPVPAEAAGTVVPFRRPAHRSRNETPGFARPRPLAATLAMAAALGFLVGWTQPLMFGGPQPLDVAEYALGPDSLDESGL